MATKKFKCKVCGYVHEGNKAPEKCPLCGAPASEFEEVKAERKLDTNSNAYTLIYASVLVVIVAFLLAFVSSSLREKQSKNVELDTKKQILAALNVKEVADADAAYNTYIKADMLLQEDGTLAENAGAFATAYEKEYKENNRLHVFVAEVDGQKKYIFPVYGVGLWGAIWGYVALNSDKNTVYGVYFSHASETPGLGAEIASPRFQERFLNRKSVADGQVVLSVVKNGKVENPDSQVDGVSGGTITSLGVNDMLHKCLGNYQRFLTNDKED